MGWALLGARGLHAQATSERWRNPTWLDDVTFTATNAAVSGLAAGLVRLVRGGSFADAFARGALGGTVSFAGKRLAARHFGGAGLLGRQVSALGASMARNAAAGAPMLDELLFPLGPLRFVWRPSGGVSAKVDLLGLYWTGYALAEDRLRLDAGASLSAGAFVFEVDGADLEGANGTVRGDVVFVDATRRRDAVLAHERAHVLQLDMVYALVSDPIDRWVADLVGGPAPTIGRYANLHVATGLLPLLAPIGLVDLIEFEAEYLEVR